MIYRTEYASTLVGPLLLASDGGALLGCRFKHGRYVGHGIGEPMHDAPDLDIFAQTASWFDRYFAGDRPNPHELPLAPAPTPFQARVREAMLAIPYGSTATYGNIAAAIERKTGARQSARAVGGAVGHNPLCIIVPCHRVMGAHGNLTGFGGGIDAKVALLAHEGALRDSFTRPTHGTAL